MKTDIESKRMCCWHCGVQMIWGSDFSFEDFCIEGEGIVSTFHCPNCPATADVYSEDVTGTPIKK